MADAGKVARSIDASGSVAAQAGILGALVDVLIALRASVSLRTAALVGLHAVYANMLGILTDHTCAVVDVRLKPA